MTLLHDLFLNLLINPLFWYILVYNIGGIYFLTYILYHDDDEKYAPLAKIVNGFLSFIVTLFPFLIHFTTQPRIYGSLGTFLTPSNQIIMEPFVNFSLFLGYFLSIIGIITTFLGVVLFIAALNRISKVIGLDQFKSEEILTKGLYGIVRNPLYTSLMIIYIGMALILGAVYSLLLAPLFYGLLWGSGLIEIHLNLEKKFGKDKVNEYKSKVPYSLFNKTLWVLIVFLLVYLIILAVIGYFPLY